MQPAIGETKLGADGSHIVEMREAFKQCVYSPGMYKGVVIQKQNIVAPRLAHSTIAGAQETQILCIANELSS